MKKLADVIIVIGVVSMVFGIISRFTMTPVKGIFASAFLEFAGVCMLLAIALLVREK